MARERFEGDYGRPVRRPGERLEHESKIADPRPRERRRDRTALELLLLGAIVGAALFALAVWLIASLTDHHYPPLTYIVTGAIGGVLLATILPYLALARSDGSDARIVQQRDPGTADTPVEGAEATDQPHTAHSQHGER
jgi:hypothetical protein